MNTVQYIYKYSFKLIFLMLISSYAHAQVEEEAERPVTIDSFDVVRDYKPLLADAVKIRRSPDMSNKRSYMPKLTYTDIKDQKLDINTGLKELNVREMPFAVREDILSNYVKAGIGNFNTFLGEAYLSVEDYEDIRFGGFVKHLGQKGTLDKQTFSKQEIGAFGRRILPDFTVDGMIGFNRYATHFYGDPIAQNGDFLNADKNEQAFNDLYFSGELTSNYDPDAEESMSYSAKIDAYSFKDKYSASENAVAISGYLNKKIKAFNIGANVAADLGTMEGMQGGANSTKVNNSLAILNPYIRFKGDNYAVTLGANLIPEFGDSTGFNVFPAAEVDFSLVPEYLHLFGGIKGTVERGSFKRFANDNPYLAKEQDIRNTIERMSFFGGLKGNMGATFGYKARVFYKQLENMPMFSVNPESPYQFDVIYDGDGDNAVKHIGLEGEMNVRVSEMLNLGGRINFNDYTMVNEREAWNLPKLKLTAMARFTLSEKLFIDAEALFASERYTKTYEYATGDVSSIVDLDGQTSLPTFFDLSASAEYKATPQLGIFVKANNMFNTEYEKYINYPRLGFNFVGGLNFSF